MNRRLPHRAALWLVLTSLLASPHSLAGNAVNNPPTAGGGGGSGTVTSVISTDGTVTVTNPTGPTVNLSAASAGVVFTNGVSTGAIQLSALGSASYNEGQLAYVATLKALYVLTASTQPASALVRVAASGKTGYLWLRAPDGGPGWWSQLIWYVDPANSSGSASDENTGASNTGAGVGPLATMAELNRRFHGRNLPGAETNSYAVNLLSNCADTDFLQVHLDPNARNINVNVTLQGTGAAVVVPVGVIASAVAKVATTNTPNKITVTGFDFSPYVGKIVRLTGTPATHAVVEKAPSLGVAELSEQNTGPASIGSGFTTGQTVEFWTVPRCPGAWASGPGVSVLWTDIEGGTAAGGCFILAPYNWIPYRCTFPRGLSATVGNLGVLPEGCAFQGACAFNGCAFSPTGGAVVAGALTLSAGPTRNHLASFGLRNSQIITQDGAIIRLNSDFHCFDLAASAIGISMGENVVVYSAGNYYGAGNNASSQGVNMIANARFMYSAVPVMDAGIGVAYDSGSTMPFTGGLGVGLPLVPGVITALPGALQSSKLNAMMAI